MSKKRDDNAPISAQKFMDELWRYKRGSISRRQFSGRDRPGNSYGGSGNSGMPSLWPRKSHAFGDLGDRLVFSTWPNYHDQANLDEFSPK